MKCPECNTWTSVLESRQSTGNTRKRRYECANLHRFSTLETIIVRKTPIHKVKKAAETGGKP